MQCQIMLTDCSTKVRISDVSHEEPGKRRSLIVNDGAAGNAHDSALYRLQFSLQYCTVVQNFIVLFHQTSGIKYVLYRVGQRQDYVSHCIVTLAGEWGTKVPCR
jgi:hypothetical protein